MVFEKIETIGAAATERKTPPPPPGKDAPKVEQTFYEPEKKEDKKAEDKPAATAPVGKMDKEEAKKSGQANAYITAGSLELLFTGIEMFRHSQSMSRADKMKVIALKKTEADKWTAADKALNEEFIRLSEKHNRIKESIPSTDKQMDNLTYGFSLYAEVTGKKTSPEVIIGGSIVRYIGEKILQMI